MPNYFIEAQEPRQFVRVGLPVGNKPDPHGRMHKNHQIPQLPRRLETSTALGSDPRRAPMTLIRCVAYESFQTQTDGFGVGCCGTRRLRLFEEDFIDIEGLLYTYRMPYKYGSGIRPTDRATWRRLVQFIWRQRNIVSQLHASGARRSCRTRQGPWIILAAGVLRFIHDRHTAGIYSGYLSGRIGGGRDP